MHVSCFHQLGQVRILSAIEADNPHDAAELLPLVYDELRKFATARMAVELRTLLRS